MVKEKKSSKKKEWVQKGEYRTEIRNNDEELFPYYKGHQTLQDLKKVAKDVLEWAQNSNHTNITTFCTERQMSPPRMYEWMERCPELKEAWYVAKTIIGNRREQGALEGRYTASIVLAKMPLYDDEYRAWKEKMSANSTGVSGGTVVVNMNRIESDIAPRKEEE